ncbi:MULTISPECIES: DUF6380 family protein [unclassified Streptomyces]
MDKLGQGDSNGGNRQATLRCRVASLTATTCRASFKHRGTVEGEGAR